MFLILAAGCLLLPGAGATYAGDKPLNATFTGTINGGYLFTTGNSTYHGSLKAGDTYQARFDPALPNGASVTYRRLYVYWTWSSLDHKAIYPRFAVTRADGPGPAPVPVNRYVDNKGVTGTNDFFCGMDVFDLPVTGNGRENVTVSVLQAGPAGSSVALQGTGLLLVYELPGGSRQQIQVLEGSDLLYSSYGISPEMATSTVVFTDPVPVHDAGPATLLLVAPSGGYSRSDLPDKNRLYLNWIPEENIPFMIRTILSVIFPTYRGKEWSDVFLSDELRQIGIEERDVTGYLRAQDNRVAVQDRGDYLQLCNAILSVRTGG